MKKLLLIAVLVILVMAAACGEPEAADAAPAQSDITIVPEGGQQTAEIAVGIGGADALPTDAPTDSAPDAHTDTSGHFEDDVVAAIPTTLDALTAELTMTYDADGNEVWSDGTRTVSSYEWDIEGERAHRMVMDTEAYRYIAGYLPNGKLHNITVVPLSTIDPTVCSDAYLTYAELYCYGEEVYGYLYNVEQDGVVLQQNFTPEHTPLFTCAITLNVFGEGVETALYDAQGMLVCKAIGAEDAGEDTRTYEDGDGNAITEEQHDALALGLCGDWLNDYYGNVYGA